MISVTEATATILSLSPNEPAITLALSATLSITQSRRGDVKTCCQPVDSFTLKQSITAVAPACTCYSEVFWTEILLIYMYLTGPLINEKDPLQTGPLTLLKPLIIDVIYVTE